MAYQPIEELLPKADWSIYKLVRMASERALELSEGKPSMIKKPETDKLTTIALQEIAQGYVVSKGSAARVQEEMQAAQEQSDIEKEE